MHSASLDLQEAAVSRFIDTMIEVAHLRLQVWLTTYMSRCSSKDLVVINDAGLWGPHHSAGSQLW